MKLYLSENPSAAKNKVALDDMILTKDLPTTAGSKMLDGYMSLFSAEVADKLTAAGFDIAGKVNVGEFAIDLLGETSHYGAVTSDGKLSTASAELLRAGEVKAVIHLDVNGMPRRAAALNNLVFVKPTYGTVSRYGTVPAACSGETVGVLAASAGDAKEVLAAVMGHDDKDGTSLPADKCCLQDGKISKVVIAKAFLENVDAATAEKIDAAKAKLEAAGITVAEIDGSLLKAARLAWNICMSAELCNNVSRYDGVKYGYRSANYTNIDELYTNSRTEAFGELTKTAILYGSETLSTENYQKVYDKALRIRRVISEELARILADADAILLPACSKASYTEADTAANLTLSFDEALYTAPASLTGLPAVAAGGVQLIGRAFGESALLDAAAIL